MRTTGHRRRVRKGQKSLSKLPQESADEELGLTKMDEEWELASTSEPLGPWGPIAFPSKEDWISESTVRHAAPHQEQWAREFEGKIAASAMDVARHSI